MTTMQKIAKWFKFRGNEAATFAEICDAFPGITRKSISSALSKKMCDSNENMRYVFPARGVRGHYTYFLNPVLPIYNEVENFSEPEEVEIDACEGDCSHCEAETCKFKGEVETKAKKLSIKDRIANWFRDNGNEPAFLWEVVEAFPDINPKTISGILSKRDSNGKFNFEHDYDYNYGRGRNTYSLWEEDYAPSASEKPLAEAETCAAEEGEEVENISPEKMLATEFFTGSEAESSSIAKSLKSIAESLAQIAEVETSIAKHFLNSKAAKLRN